MLLTIEDVSIKLQVTPQTIRAKIKKDSDFASLFMKIGRGYRVKVEDLDKWLTDQQIKTVE